MLHDRGCFRCYEDRQHYKDCKDPDCVQIDKSPKIASTDHFPKIKVPTEVSFKNELVWKGEKQKLFKAENLLSHVLSEFKSGKLSVKIWVVCDKSYEYGSFIRCYVFHDHDWVRACTSLADLLLPWTFLDEKAVVGFLKEDPIEFYDREK